MFLGQIIGSIFETIKKTINIAFGLGSRETAGGPPAPYLIKEPIDPLILATGIDCL